MINGEIEYSDPGEVILSFGTHFWVCPLVCFIAFCFKIDLSFIWWLPFLYLALPASRVPAVPVLVVALSRGLLGENHPPQSTPVMRAQALL